MARNWIKRVLRGSRPGALHRQLGVPVGKKIPRRLLEKNKHKGGKLGHRVRLAITLRKLARRRRRRR